MKIRLHKYSHCGEPKYWDSCPYGDKGPYGIIRCKWLISGSCYEKEKQTNNQCFSEANMKNFKFPTWEDVISKIDDSRFTTLPNNYHVREGARIMYDRLYVMLAEDINNLTQRAADLSGTTSKGKDKHHGPQGG